MTSQKTPVQGGATEEQIEAAARAMFDARDTESDDREWFDIRDDEYEGRGWSDLDHERKDLLRMYARVALGSAFAFGLSIEAWRLSAAIRVYRDRDPEEFTAEWMPRVLSASASAYPADEHHDAEERGAESEDHAATVAGEPLYSPATGAWSSTCPCVRAEQVDPECEWHGREEFRRGGSHHPETRGPSDEMVARAARVLHIASCCNLSETAEHQEPQNEDLMTAGIVLSSIPIAATVTGDRKKLIDSCDHPEKCNHRYRLWDRLADHANSSRRRGKGSPNEESRVDIIFDWMTQEGFALAAPVEVDEAKLAEAKYVVDSVHQIHGTECLCGFASDRSRSRTAHITEALVSALRGEGR